MLNNRIRYPMFGRMVANFGDCEGHGEKDVEVEVDSCVFVRCQERQRNWDAGRL